MQWRGTRPCGASLTWRQGRVERLGEEDELELDALLELDRDGVGLLQEDGVAPEVVAQRGELVLPPLGEAEHRQLVLALRPVALRLEYGVHCKWKITSFGSRNL